jgi:uncharacterized protein (TIGR02271 family)
LTTKQRSTVVGVFHDPSRAQEAVRDLKQAGFHDDQIGVVAPHAEAAGEAGTQEKGSHAVEGAVAGVAAGAGVGALWALGIAAGFLPVIGPVIAGGLLASVLASAAGGAAIAGIVGALVGLGIPEEEAHYYEGEVKSGRTIVTVKADGRSDEAWAVLHRHGAYNRQTQNATAADTAAGKAEGDQTLQVREEELRATKRSVDAGAVRVRKEVVTENKTLQVPVTREEVVIERHPASGRATPGAGVGAGEEVRIPVKEEKVHIEKEAVVAEEVSVGKRKVADTQTVSGSVRKERVKVEQEGDVEVRGGPADSKGKRK